MNEKFDACKNYRTFPSSHRAGVSFSKKEYKLLNLSYIMQIYFFLCSQILCYLFDLTLHILNQLGKLAEKIFLALFVLISQLLRSLRWFTSSLYVSKITANSIKINYRLPYSRDIVMLSSHWRQRNIVQGFKRLYRRYCTCIFAFYEIFVQLFSVLLSLHMADLIEVEKIFPRAKLWEIFCWQLKKCKTIKREEWCGSG